jgi:hypothetical protein
VEPATLGDPVRPLLWVSKSHDKLAATLTGMGHSISPNSVRKLLCELGFSREANARPKRAPFGYINAGVLATQAANQPVISVESQPKGSAIWCGCADLVVLTPLGF